MWACNRVLEGQQAMIGRGRLGKKHVDTRASDKTGRDVVFDMDPAS
jgi:hypothetical protein